jgi:hypothetical protein
MKSIFTKKLENKTLYLLPTGNNVNRAKPVLEQAKVALIVNVTPTKVTFVLDGSSYERTYKIGGGADNRLNNGNDGYTAYLTTQSLDSHIISTTVKDNLRDIQIVSNMTDEQTAAIAKIMKWEV